MSKCQIVNNLQNSGGIYVGKLTAALSRLVGYGGSSLPGYLACSVAPGLLPYLAGQADRGTVVIAGTNGKTTTTFLLAGILNHAGIKTVYNSSGANLPRGMTSSLLDACTWNRKLKREAAVMESDEVAFAGAVQALNPRIAIITNIFRDQLDRYGEVESVRIAIEKGLKCLSDGSMVLLNADDPIVADLKPQENVKIFYYGLELSPFEYGHEHKSYDIKSCPVCRKALNYSSIYFGHLGCYHCTSCSFKRPEPHFKLVKPTTDHNGSNLATLVFPQFTFEFRFPLPGIYNLYNALAAAACAAIMEMDQENLKESLEKARASFGRMEQFTANDHKVSIGLIKNPAGANEVLRTLMGNPGPFNLLIVINDNYADGTDISWLWDVDFERLNEHMGKIDSIVVSGNRAADMSVRLKYAGLPVSRFITETGIKKAFDLSMEKLSPEGQLLILPTYTAMMELRKHLHRQGIVKPFWEE